MITFNENNTNKKNVIETMLDSLFSTSITDFGNWSGVRVAEDGKKGKGYTAFKEAESFKILIGQYFKYSHVKNDLLHLRKVRYAWIFFLYRISTPNTSDMERLVVLAKNFSLAIQLWGLCSVRLLSERKIFYHS